MTKETQPTASEIAPWNDVDRVFDELHARFLDTVGLRPLGAGYPAASDLFRAARVDVSDTGTAFKIVAEIPGIPKENLDIRVRGPQVEIRGEQVKESEKTDAEFVHRERAYAGYYRSLELPEAVVADKATARVTNGLLELELPKEHPNPAPAEVKVAVQ